jgi:AcrR family transcriptional regulator
LRPPEVSLRIDPPVVRRRGQGRDRILAAAGELFGAKGYRDVSMADVAKAAGVTKAALYYHFADKAELYTRVSLDRIDGIRSAMEAAAASGGSLEERLIRLVMVGFERLEADVYGPHLQAHGHLDDAHHQQLHAAMEGLTEPVVRCFEEAGPASPAISPKAAAALLGGIVASLIFQLEDPGPLPADRHERASLAIRLFLRGYWSVAGDTGPEEPAAG